MTAKKILTINSRKEDTHKEFLHSAVIKRLMCSGKTQSPIAYIQNVSLFIFLFNSYFTSQFKDKVLEAVKKQGFGIFETFFTAFFIDVTVKTIKSHSRDSFNAFNFLIKRILVKV